MGSAAILTIWSLPTDTHGRSSQLFRSLTSSNILQFQCTNLPSLVKFSQFFDALVNGIIFLISSLYYSVLVYRNNWFCILILFPATLQDLFTGGAKVTGDTPHPQKPGRDMSCACVTGDLVPLLNMVTGGGAKANMVDTGPHQSEGRTLPLAFSMHGILGQDFGSPVCREAKRLLVLSHSPGRGYVNGQQWACQWWPVQAYERRPGGTDSERCLKLDSEQRPAKPPMLKILLVGKEVPGATLNWAGRGSQCDLSLGS